VRPVREQFEHDRIIRLLQARYRRKFEVAINPGAEQNASVMSGELALFPDLVLFSPERGRKLQGTVEVETTESVNQLEAMAEWGPYSRLRAPFHLYVPPNSIDTARRLCAEHQVVVSEIWTYHTAADQVRFTMVHRAPESPQQKSTKSDRVELAKPPKPVLKEQAVEEQVAAPVARVAKDTKVTRDAKVTKDTKSTKDTKAAAAKAPVAKAPAAKVTKSTKAAKPAKATKPTKPARPAKSTKAAKHAKAAKGSKPAKKAAKRR
jgi:hypothetical protein